MFIPYGVNLSHSLYLFLFKLPSFNFSFLSFSLIRLHSHTFVLPSVSLHLKHTNTIINPFPRQSLTQMLYIIINSLRYIHAIFKVVLRHLLFSLLSFSLFVSKLPFLIEIVITINFMHVRLYALFSLFLFFFLFSFFDFFLINLSVFFLSNRSVFTSLSLSLNSFPFFIIIC